MVADQPLARYTEDVAVILGDLLQDVLLFGSRAAGTQRADSDYDVAIVVAPGADVRLVRGLVSDAAFPYVIRGIDIRPVVICADRWDEASPFMRHIRTVGKRIRARQTR